MAENWTVAFGRYLRELRERRGLSLNEVATLSQAFADDVQKGYLSRVENGRQRLAFSKVIALSRIYEVPADVLLERMELDLELERIGGPETEGLGYRELLESGKKALDHGTYWVAYGFFRDACHLAGSAELIEPYTSIHEQVRLARVNVATAVMHTDRHGYILYELDFVESDPEITDEMRVLVLERKSVVLRRLEDLDGSRDYVEKAITLAKRVGPDCRYLGYTYSSAGLTYGERGEYEKAAERFRAAHDVYVAQDRLASAARCLTNLAQIYVLVNNMRAARRALSAAYRQAQALDMKQGMALTRILLGELEEMSDHDDAAEEYFREAARIAKDIDYRAIEFRADYYLLKLAHKNGKHATARALTKKLRKQSNWVAKDLPELRLFRELVDDSSTELRRDNSA